MNEGLQGWRHRPAIELAGKRSDPVTTMLGATLNWVRSMARGWGNIKLGRWNSDGAVITAAGVAVVIYIGAYALAGKVPASAVVGGAAAGATMSYLIDCGNRWRSLDRQDKVRFVALMAGAYVLGSVVGLVLFPSA